MFSKGIRIGLVLGMFCLFSLLAVEVRAEDFGVVKEGKSVILTVDGQEFVVDTSIKKGYLRGTWLTSHRFKTAFVGSQRIIQSISSKDVRGLFTSEQIEELKVLLDKENEKVVYLKGKAYNYKKKKILESFSLETNLRIKKGFPCLFIHQRLTNLGNSPRNVCMINRCMDRISLYAGPGTEINEVPQKKGWVRLVVNRNWIWAKGEKLGFGIISFTPTDFSCATLYWNWSFLRQTELFLEEGDSIEYRMAITIDKTLEEVKGLYEKIKDMELKSFLCPGEQVVWKGEWK